MARNVGLTNSKEALRRENFAMQGDREKFMK